MKAVRAMLRMLFIALSARTLIVMPLGGVYASGANLPQNLLRIAQIIYQRKTLGKEKRTMTIHYKLRMPQDSAIVFIDRQPEVL